MIYKVKEDLINNKFSSHILFKNETIISIALIDCGVYLTIIFLINFDSLAKKNGS